MKTLAFIGSDKNAGKTTVLNFIYAKLVNKKQTICIETVGNTSINECDG